MANGFAHANNFNLIRLFAAAQVLAVHALNHNGVSGFLPEALKATPGVPIFFFISGYLISSSYLRTRMHGLKEFFRNRVLRIYPALIICVLLSTVMVLLTGYLVRQSYSTSHLLLWVLGQMSVVQFYNPDFMRGFGVGVLNGALWTITVELQFYLLTPFLIWLISRSKPLAAMLFGASLLCNIYLAWVGGDRSMADKLLSVTFLPWIYMFMVGMFLALSPKLVEANRKPSGLILLIPLYVLSLFLIGGYTLNAQNSINPVSFVILTLIVFKIAYAPINFAAGFQTFVRRNDFSYGIYLYHMPVINLMLFLSVAPAIGIPAIAVLAVTLAILSWFVIERPALRRKH